MSWYRNGVIAGSSMMSMIVDGLMTRTEPPARRASRRSDMNRRPEKVENTLNAEVKIRSFIQIRRPPFLCRGGSSIPWQSSAEEFLKAVFLRRLREVVGGPILPVGLPLRHLFGVHRRGRALALALLHQPGGDDVLARFGPQLEIVAGAGLGTGPSDDPVQRAGVELGTVQVPSSFGTIFARAASSRALSSRISMPLSVMTKN